MSFICTVVIRKDKDVVCWCRDGYRGCTFTVEDFLVGFAKDFLVDLLQAQADAEYRSLVLLPVSPSASGRHCVDGS
jgi:hypothetical protein